MGRRKASVVRVKQATENELAQMGNNSGSELTYLYIFHCVNARITKHAVWSTQSAPVVSLALSFNYSTRVAITWAVCCTHFSWAEMPSSLPTIVRGHDIDRFVVRALDRMASVLTDSQQPATIPCPTHTAVWNLFGRRDKITAPLYDYWPYLPSFSFRVFTAFYRTMI